VRLTRFALGAGVVVVVAFMLLVAIGMHGAFTPIIAILALGGLIACGNLLYGKHSHGAAATARVRPAQEAQNRAIDETQAQARLAREQARQQRQQARRRRWSGGASGGGETHGGGMGGMGGAGGGR
jgi:type VI protein secretion system component VasK